MTTKASAEDGVASSTGRPKPSWAMIGIFVIVALAAATLARGFLLPLTLAILLFFVFSPACRMMARIGVPQALSAAAVTLTLFAALGAAVAVFAVPLASAIDDAPTIFQALDRKLDRLQGSVKEIQQAVDQINELSKVDDTPPGVTPDADPEPEQEAAPSSGPDVITNLAMTTPAVFAQLVFTLVLLYFALASRELLYHRIVESFTVITEKRQALSAMHEIEESLGNYLGAITLINAGLGVAVGLAMWAWGMPAPALFGAAAFTFNYVPYLGAVAGVVVSTVVALLSMDGLVQPFLVGLTYLMLTSIEGQLITPYFVSQRLRLNTVVVFIAVALFAWLWSIVGMIVAVPLLVVLNVVASAIPGMRGISHFLSGQGGEDWHRIDEDMPSLAAELPETQRHCEEQEREKEEEKEQAS